MCLKAFLRISQPSLSQALFSSQQVYYQVEDLL